MTEPPSKTPKTTPKKRKRSTTRTAQNEVYLVLAAYHTDCYKRAGGWTSVRAVYRHEAAAYRHAIESTIEEIKEKLPHPEDLVDPTPEDIKELKEEQKPFHAIVDRYEHGHHAVASLRGILKELSDLNDEVIGEGEFTLSGSGVRYSVERHTIHL